MEQLLEQAEAFRAQKPGEDVDPSWTLLTGMKLPKSFVTKYEHPQAPVFTHMIDNNFPNLYEDDEIVIYMNAALPYVDAYPGCESRAAMSFLHLLICPKERIYNFKTLRKDGNDRYLLLNMRSTVEDLISCEDFMIDLEQSIIRQSFTYDESQFGAFTVERRVKLLEALYEIRNIRKQQLFFCFHEHPDHSVGHLHMHCILTTTLTDSYGLNSHKNVPLDAVLGRLRA